MNLTTEEIILFRTLKRSGVMLMLMLRLDKPTGEREIAEILELDRQTARSHLRSLAHFGLVSRAHYHNGYLLTAKGRQQALLLAQSGLGPSHHLELKAGKFPPSELAGPPGPSLVGMPTDPTAGEQGVRHATLVGEDFPEGGAPYSKREKSPLYTGDFPALPINTTTTAENSKFNYDNRSSSSNIPENCENSPDPPDDPGGSDGDRQEVIDALAARGITLNSRTRRLLGSITVQDISDTYTHLLRQNKQTQTGLFVTILEAKARHAALDLTDTKGWVTGSAYELPPGYQQDDDDESSPSLADLVDGKCFDGPPAVLDAWQQAVERLEAEIPKGDYRTWVKPVLPSLYHPDPPEVVVVVVNHVARDRLKERVKEKLERLLAEILTYPLRVSFYAYWELEAETQGAGEISQPDPHHGAPLPGEVASGSGLA